MALAAYCIVSSTPIMGGTLTQYDLILRSNDGHEERRVIGLDPGDPTSRIEQAVRAFQVERDAKTAVLPLVEASPARVFVEVSGTDRAAIR